MFRFKSKMRTLSTLMAGLVLAAPAEASVEGASLTFSPGKGLRPQVTMARGTVGAGQRVITGSSEVCEILFPDGTSVTLAPVSDMKVEAFDYSETGDDRLVLEMEKGLMRVAGGRLNDRAPVIVKTAAGEVRLDAASAVVEVSAEGRTRTSLLFGRGVELRNGGQTQSAQRPGFELVSLAGKEGPERPVRQPEGMAATDAFALGTAQLAGLSKEQEDQLGRVGLTELVALGTSTLALATEQQPLGTVSGPVETPLSPPISPTFGEIGDTPGGFGASGFAPGSGVDPNKVLALGQPTDAATPVRSLEQNRGNATFNNGALNEQVRGRAPTTNRVFSSTSLDPYSQTFGSGNPPPFVIADRFDVDPSTGARTVIPYPPDPQLQYIFRTDQSGDGALLGIELVGQTKPADGDSSLPPGATHILYDVSPRRSFNSTAPFFLSGFPSIKWPTSPKDSGTTITMDIEDNTANSVGNGSGFNTTASHWEFLQAGFQVVSVTIPSGNQRMTMERNPDNFLLLQVRPGKLDPQNNSCAAPPCPQLDSGRPERFIFATGNVDGGRLTLKADGTNTLNADFKNTFGVDRFFVSAGLSENFDPKSLRDATVASDTRAFLRMPTGLGLNLTDSGFFVVNNGPNLPTTAPNGFLHADFGMQGAGGLQQSTLSVTLGDVTYALLPTCGGCILQYSAVASGRTIGSSHGTTTGGPVGTVAISSPIMSTSFGGGNPQINRAGYAGYFVLENYAPPCDGATICDQDVSNRQVKLLGGTEHSLGSSTANDTSYAMLRLATGTAGQVSVGSRSNATLTGWAGGIGEKENGPGQLLTYTPIGTGTSPGNFVVTTDAINNRVRVDLQLSGHFPMTLGGPENRSAMIDDSRFAAANSSVAMVNANVLRDAGGNLPASLKLPNGQPISQYQYLQWGFIFGDTAGSPGGDLEHLHMGTWVAGRLSDPSQLPTTGTASYSGHAIGNVVNGTALYTAVGSYENTWDFAKRTGTADMNFDGAHYRGPTQIMNGTAVFQGAMTAADAARKGGLVGNFVQAPGGSPAGMPPPAVAGRFVIQETAGTPYRASGTFGAERSH
ncbi:FecR domain-containing protein [Paraburkholderia sp. XV]|uniref:FecR domain-containing protein n=1 Tax=Paraburkholderia sp. XV TaxID=2831520 RepID=UPI001CD5EA6F|nr:FecR domain-containing protein [Paraburkholderia sp. XV]